MKRPSVLIIGDKTYTRTNRGTYVHLPELDHFMDVLADVALDRPVSPIFKKAILKSGSTINLAIFDMVLNDEAEKWVRTQFAKKRRVYREETGDAFGDDYILFATDIDDQKKLESVIPKRMPMFEGSRIVLRELKSPEDLSPEAQKVKQEAGPVSKETSEE